MAIGFPARSSSSRTFYLQQDDLVAVIEFALDNLGWSYQVQQGNEFLARVPLSGFSWGEEFRIKILPGGVVQADSKSTYMGWFDLGKNRRNIETFFAMVEHCIKQGVFDKATSEANREAIKQAMQAAAPAQHKVLGSVLGGCLIGTLILATLIYFISAVVGLFTGYLYLPSRGHGGVIQGVWARIFSVIILAFYAWLILWFRRNRRKRQP